MNTDWIDIETMGLPKQPGDYLCKDHTGKEFMSLLMRRKSGKTEKLVWLDNRYLPYKNPITHYKPTP